MTFGFLDNHWRQSGEACPECSGPTEARRGEGANGLWDRNVRCRKCGHVYWAAEADGQPIEALAHLPREVAVWLLECHKQNRFAASLWQHLKDGRAFSYPQLRAARRAAKWHSARMKRTSDDDTDVWY